MRTGWLDDVPYEIRGMLFVCIFVMGWFLISLFVNTNAPPPTWAQVTFPIKTSVGTILDAAGSAAPGNAVSLDVRFVDGTRSVFTSNGMPSDDIERRPGTWTNTTTNEVISGTDADALWAARTIWATRAVAAARVEDNALIASPWIRFTPSGRPLLKRDEPGAAWAVENMIEDMIVESYRMIRLGGLVPEAPEIADGLEIRARNGETRIVVPVSGRPVWYDLSGPRRLSRVSSIAAERLMETAMSALATPLASATKSAR